MQTRRWEVCKRNGGVQIQSTEKLFDVLRSKVISRQSIRIKIMLRIHVIEGDRTRLFSAVPDSPNAFLIIGPEEVDGTKNIFVPFGSLKGGAASIVRLRPNPFSFSALRESVDGSLPGRFGRVGLRGPYRRGKASRWRRNILQDGNKWLRRPHSNGSQLYAKVRVGARVAAGRSNLLYAPSTIRPKLFNL
jgi:hypothetical protein